MTIVGCDLHTRKQQVAVLRHHAPACANGWLVDVAPAKVLPSSLASESAPREPRSRAGCHVAPLSHHRVCARGPSSKLLRLDDRRHLHPASTPDQSRMFRTGK